MENKRVKFLSKLPVSSLQRTLTFSLILLSSNKLFAGDRNSHFELGGGPVAVEEGDDRVRPAALVHIGFADAYMARVYSYGRKYGPVKERTHIVAAQRRVSMFDIDGLTAALGFCFLNEYTQINFPDDSSQNDEEDNTNFGFAVGVHYRIEKVSPIYFEFSWDSHVFLAGPQGGLLLANGRKQTFAVGLGVRL